MNCTCGTRFTLDDIRRCAQRLSLPRYWTLSKMSLYTLLQVRGVVCGAFDATSMWHFADCERALVQAKLPAIVKQMVARNATRAVRFIAKTPNFTDGQAVAWVKRVCGADVVCALRDDYSVMLRGVMSIDWYACVQPMREALNREAKTPTVVVDSAYDAFCEHEIAWDTLMGEVDDVPPMSIVRERLDVSSAIAYRRTVESLEEEEEFRGAFVDVLEGTGDLTMAMRRKWTRPRVQKKVAALEFIAMGRNDGVDEFIRQRELAKRQRTEKYAHKLTQADEFRATNTLDFWLPYPSETVKWRKKLKPETFRDFMLEVSRVRRVLQRQSYVLPGIPKEHPGNVDFTKFRHNIERLRAFTLKNCVFVK